MDFEFMDEKFRIREESDDFLFSAYDEPVKSKAIKLAKKALEIYPDNIDAENFITKCEENTVKKLDKYKKTLNKAKEILEKDNVFDEKNIGIFWGLMETRSFMRTKHSYMLTLMELGRYTEALQQGEEMLKLCKNDNLGIRYLMSGMYIILEKFEECEKLYNTYKEETTFMLFPKAIMYYKKGNYTKSKKVINEIKEENPYIIDLYTGKIKFTKQKIQKIEENGMYSIGSEEEAYFVLKDLKYLICTVPDFVNFVE